MVRGFLATAGFSAATLVVLALAAFLGAAAAGAAILAMALAKRDFKREALFLWIKWVLAALSNLEKAAESDSAFMLVRAFLSVVRKAVFLALLAIVRFLSWRIFLMACLSIGI